MAGLSRILAAMASVAVASFAATPLTADDEEGIDLREELPEGVTLTGEITKKVMDWHNLEPVYFANTFRRDNGDPDTVGLSETVFAVNPETDQVYIWDGVGGLRDDTPEIGEYSPLYILATIGENFQMNDFTRHDWFQNPHPFVEKHNISDADFSDTNPICNEMGLDPQEVACGPYDAAMGTRINKNGHNAAFCFVVDSDNAETEGMDGKVLRTYLIGKVQDGEQEHYKIDFYETSQEGVTVAGKTARDIYITKTGGQMMRNSP